MVTSGVDQGNISGPILFPFYLDRVFDMLITKSLKFCADDVKNLRNRVNLSAA